MRGGGGAFKGKKFICEKCIKKKNETFGNMPGNSLSTEATRTCPHGSLKKWHRKKRHRKKWHRKKRHKEKMAQEKMAQCMIGKNGTILFLLKTEINKFFKLYILLTIKMEKGRQKTKRSP